MTHKKRLLGIAHSSVLLAVVLSLIVPASASWKEKVLYSFQGGTSDGSVPAGGVVFDPQGNLYGATTDGGPATCKPIGGACGTVFQLSPPAQKGGAWTETLIYQFQGKGSNDASVPSSGLIRDATGNLYGVTGYGGAGDCVLLGVLAGCGSVYELSPPKQKGGAWTETILYSFPTAKQGYLPNGDLVFDSAGNLYGATIFGGGKGTTCDKFYGGQCGVVFKLSPPKQKGGKWTEKVLHSFAGGKDGAYPSGALILDSKGAVYGTTYFGGYNCPHNSNQGCGTVFELKPPATKSSTWIENVIYRFNPARSYEAWPMDGLIMDRNGRLFGTTHEDTVFRFAPNSKRKGSWTETILYSFKGKGASYALDAPLIFDSTGNLYSTAYAGSGGSLNGNVFRLRPPTGNAGVWTIDVLYSFAGSPDGALPAAGLIFDQRGDLYSTTQAGGTGQSCQGGCGTVFEAFP
jgi:hypothetical protein